MSDLLEKNSRSNSKDAGHLCRWDIWQIGRCKFAVRSSQLPSLKASQEPAVEGGQNESADCKDQEVIVQAKLEYHSQKAAQGELITDVEVAKWWLASHLHMGASVWVSFDAYKSFLCSKTRVLKEYNVATCPYLCTI